jgi:hypothetical protein
VDEHCAIGCIASVNRELIIYCWRLRDFPGIKAEEVVVTQDEARKEKH